MIADWQPEKNYCSEIHKIRTVKTERNAASLTSAANRSLFLIAFLKPDTCADRYYIICKSGIAMCFFACE